MAEDLITLEPVREGDGPQVPLRDGPVTPSDEAVAARFRGAAMAAGVVLGLQALVVLLVPLLVIPTFRSIYTDMGGDVPFVTSLLFMAGPFIGVVLAAIDVLAFWGFYRLARKHSVGLLLVPLLIGGLLMGALFLSLYLPMYQSVTLVN